MGLMKNEFVDFSNTEIAFSHKTDAELKKSARLFAFMNKKWLVDILSSLGIVAVRYRFPLARKLVRYTIFEQFVGGESLPESQDNIDRLWQTKTLTVLDYGAEGRTDEADLDEARDQFLQAVAFASSRESVPVVGIKVSALSKNELLQGKQAGELNGAQQALYERAVDRVDAICKLGQAHGVHIFIDAEESWMQDAIDEIVILMMQRYNGEQPIVYNTFQMYRHDRYDFLISSHQVAQEKGYFLGAKLVRGAYMEKERERANEMGYTSPIHQTKAATDSDYNRAVRYCLDHYEILASCAATHNMESCLLQAEIIGSRKMPRNHPNLNFCQLYGMSDHITFNLAANGYNVAKYVVYGPVKEIVPYLTRRARENTAVEGEFSREYQLVSEECKRRGL